MRFVDSTDFRVFRFFSSGPCVILTAVCIFASARVTFAQSMSQGTLQGGATQPGLLQQMRSLPNGSNLGTSRMDAVPEDLSRVKLRSGYILDLRVFNVPDLSGSYT